MKTTLFIALSAFLMIGLASCKEEICENTCMYAFDGDCDDGGPGADFDLCSLGSDCADCGVRED